MRVCYTLKLKIWSRIILSEETGHSNGQVKEERIKISEWLFKYTYIDMHKVIYRYLWRKEWYIYLWRRLVASSHKEPFNVDIKPIGRSSRRGGRSQPSALSPLSLLTLAAVSAAGISRSLARYRGLEECPNTWRTYKRKRTETVREREGGRGETHKNNRAMNQALTRHAPFSWKPGDFRACSAIGLARWLDESTT